MMSTPPTRLPAPELPTGHRSALIIATTRYDDPSLRQLRAPATDAMGLAAVLADPNIGGFDVISVVDRPAHEVRIAIDEFLASRTPEDLVVLYFSCHGVTNARRRLHFAATDTFRSKLASTGIDSVWVQDRLEECRARRQILILDCCFSGAFGRGVKGSEALGLDQLAEPGRGRAVLTASNATEYSFETPTSPQLTPGSPAPGSVFTAALLAGLRDGSADRDGDGLVTVDEAYAYAYEHVRASGAAQTPQRWLSGGEGELLFARNPSGRALIPAALPESLRAALESPLSNVRIGAIGELRDWLTSADPARVLTATRELQSIADQDSPRVAAAAMSALGHEAAHDDLRPAGRIDHQRKDPMPPAPPAVRPTWWDHRWRNALRIAVVIVALGTVTATLWWLSGRQGHDPTPRTSPSATAGTPKSPSPPSAECGAIADKFDTTELASGWEQLNGDQFVLDRGAMAITASDGADVRGDMQGDITAPFLARRVNGDFSIETAVTVNPQYSYQGAGLLVYGDSENYVRLERGFGARGAIAFEYAANGQHEKIHGPFANDSDPVWTSATVVWLRLVRTGASVKGFWHPENTTEWQELSGTAELAGDARVGVAVLNRSQPPAGDSARNPITARFSYVDVIC